MIDTLVFDFDGVIIDTETPEFETLQAVFRSHGVELDRALWQRIIGGGPKRFDPFAHLEALTGKELDRESLRLAQRQRYVDLVAASPLMPGVADYISDARRLGLRLGLASSSSRDWVEGHLSKRGLLESFEAVVTRDDVTNVKPDPELYAVSMQRLGANPENSVAIEDSLNGVTAAKLAGMYCVAVPNPMTNDMPLDGADLRLDALSDAGLEDLLGALAGAPSP